jgi:hypothetical protein
MKKIFLIGFRGTGFIDPQYLNEPALIRAGHVGIAFEGEIDFILGFHPTSEAIVAIGGEDIAIEHLRENEPLEGTLQADYEIFQRAHTLSESGSRTQVWQMVIEVTDENFAAIRSQATEWYTDKKLFIYAFPPRNQPPLEDRDNCATFPRRLGIEIPENTGQLARYIPALQAVGELWKPSQGT